MVNGCRGMNKPEVLGLISAAQDEVVLARVSMRQSCGLSTQRVEIGRGIK